MNPLSVADLLLLYVDSPQKLEKVFTRAGKNLARKNPELFLELAFKPTVDKPGGTSDEIQRVPGWAKRVVMSQPRNKTREKPIKTIMEELHLNLEDATKVYDAAKGRQIDGPQLLRVKGKSLERAFIKYG